jgi:hypothetical protein
MIKLIALVAIVVLRIFYQSPQTQAALPAFELPLQSYSSYFSGSAKFISAKGKIINDKVILNWEISGNEDAEIFEIEKSTDGKSFSLAALVFGTNNAKTDNYQFYEKAATQKMLYRIKMINKNKQTEYSKVIEITPGA